MASNEKKTQVLIVCVVVAIFLVLTVCVSIFIVFQLGDDHASGSDVQLSAGATTQPVATTTQPTEETMTQSTTQPAPETQPEETTQPTQETTQETTAETETTEQTQSTQATEETTRPEETTQSAETTQPPQPSESTQPAATPLEQLLARKGYDLQSLAQRGCNQLVTVSASGVYAEIRFYVNSGGTWKEVPELTCNGFVGRRGVTDNKQEGDRCTPTGLYPIGTAFYIRECPPTGLDVFQVTQDTYWVDDPKSKYYNQHVEGTANKDWNSAEHMILYQEYLYGFVVDYNVECVPYAGSAIFFHINDSGTAGCIATSEQKVLAYLAKLDKNQKPHILIVPSQ